MSLSFLTAVRQAPEEVALVAEGRAFCFAELAPRVAAAAAALARVAQAAVAPPGGEGPWLLLDAAPSVDTLVRLWAAFEVGVPVALLHPRWTASERARAAAVFPSGLEAAEVPWSAGGDVPGGGPPPDDGRPLAAVFTSGSAGVPKGVVLSRAAVAASARASALRLGWRAADRWLLSLAPAHVGGLAIVARCLLARRAVVLAEGAAMVPTIQRHGVTLLSVVAAQLRRLLDASDGPAPPSLRVVLVGGGPCPLPLLAEAVARGWPVLPTYGLSEAGSQVATAAPGWTPADGLALPPLPGVEVRIYRGEIQLRGEVVCSAVVPTGAFPSPFTADGWLATGDLGRLDREGRLEVLGRRDTVIVTGGENVLPEEVEAALVAVAGVREALVFGVADPVWGAVVAAAVVPAPGVRLSGAALRQTLAERLAPFKLPRRIVVVDELPRLASGKVDRRGAAQRLVAALAEAGEEGR